MEEKINRIKKRNMKLFPIYKMFSWDLLFYYAIIFLYLNQAKGFSASQIFFADAFYPLFSILFNFFGTSVTDRLGKKFSLVLGNMIISFSILLMLLMNSFELLIIDMFWQALGFCFKGICEPTILSDSTNSPNQFLKISGKGSGLYFIIDAISSLVTGFLFVFNPNLPIILCLIFCIISTLISLGFSSLPTVNSEKFKHKANFKKTINIFNQILNSKRLLCLLLFSGFFYSILATFITLRSSILVDIGVPDQYFGIIVACVQIISAIVSYKIHWLYKKFGNRTLSIISIPFATFIIISGLIISYNNNFIISLLAVLPTIFIMGFSKGVYFSAMEKYLDNFTTPEVNTKVFSLNAAFRGIIQTILSISISFLLTLTNTSHAFIIVGCIYFIILVFLLDYMKSRVGLKPEEYPKEDLIFQSTDL